MARASRRSRGRQQRGTTITVLGLVVAVVAAALAAEVIARMILPVDVAIGRQTPWRPERHALGWEHAPQQRVTWPPGSDRVVEVNAQGFLGPEVPPARPEGTFRIAVLGDDLVEGLAVGAERTFCARLQALLNEPVETKRTAEVEVINCGVSGYSTVQEFLLASPKGGNLYAQFKPDLVVVLVALPNDFLENDPGLFDAGGTVPPVAREVSRPRIVTRRGGKVEVEHTPYTLRAPNLAGALISRSTLLSLLFPNPTLRPVPRMEMSATIAALYRRELSTRFAASWTLFRTLLREMRLDAVEHNARFLAVIAPDRPEIIHGQAWLDALRSVRTSGESELDPDAMERRFDALSTDDNLPVFSLVRALRQYVCRENLRWDNPRGYGLFDPELPQLTARGHEVVAEILAGELRNRFPEPLGGRPADLSEKPARTANGRFFAGDGGGTLLLSRTSFTAVLDEPLQVRAARVVVDDVTRQHASVGYWVAGATDACGAFAGLSFDIDPARLAPGRHAVMLDVLDASGETVRLDDRLDLVTGLHFGAIEVPEPDTVLAASQEISGWAVSLRGVARVEILLGDIQVASATCSIPRPDLEEIFSRSVLKAPPGFSVTLSSSAVEPGTHQLRLRIVTHENERYDVGEPVPVTVPL